MVSSYNVVRKILGPIQRDVRALSCSIDLAIDLIVDKRIPIDDIHVTRDIYPIVAQELRKTPDAISRSVERLTNLCWDSLSVNGELADYMGTVSSYRPFPRDILLYLAFYTYYQKPYTAVCDKDLEITQTEIRKADLS